MKLTKYGHACFTVEVDGKLVVVDPGSWTTDLPALESVVAVIVTHEHPDHFDINALGAIIGHNPDAVIYAHETITRQFGDTLPNQIVVAGQVVKIGPFSFEFFGGEHAVIHSSMPVAANLGVMVNGLIYYPGDSFTTPGRQVDVLALPTVAPWMKISETIDFMNDVKPRLAFPTHDAISSDIGKGLTDRVLSRFAEQANVTYQRLNEPLEI